MADYAIVLFSEQGDGEVTLFAKPTHDSRLAPVAVRMAAKRNLDDVRDGRCVGGVLEANSCRHGRKGSDP